MSYCANCGSRFLEGTKFCHNCGAKIQGETDHLLLNLLEALPFVYDSIGDWDHMYWGENNYCISIDKRSGLIDFSGDIVVPCEYERIEQIDTENNYIVKRNGKYGLVCPQYKIPCEFDYIYEDIRICGGQIYALVEKDGKYGVLDVITGYVNYLKCDEVKIWDIYQDEMLFIVTLDGKYGVIDKDNNVLLHYKWDKISGVMGHYIATTCELSVILKYLSINEERKIKFKKWRGVYREIDYNDGLWLLKGVHNKWGLYTTDIFDSSSEIFPCEYDEIEIVKGKVKKICVKKEGVCLCYSFLENNKLQLLLNCDGLSSAFNGKYFIYKKEDKWGVNTGDVLEIPCIPCIYDHVRELDTKAHYPYDIDPGYELFIAERNGKYGVLSDKGAVIIDFRYYEIYYTGRVLCLSWWENGWTHKNIDDVDDDELGESYERFIDLEELMKKWENSNRKPIVISD